MPAEQLRERRGESLLPCPSASLFAGKYRVHRVVGRGGMGLVFAARHLKLGHDVAIKVLGSASRGRPEIVRRFEREAAAMALLSGRHSVRVLDADVTEDGVPYFVMELLEGYDLRSVILRGGSQPIEQAARWIVEACHGIAEAHRNGIVHRDLKPSNLFLANDGGHDVLKILDFGIAKVEGVREIEESPTAIGTPPYMAPEQMLRPEAVDERADVWSLGVTLYELLTGVLPIAARTRGVRLRATIPDPRKLRPSLSEREAEVVMRALRERPEERYESVSAFAEALTELTERPLARCCAAPSRELEAPVRSLEVGPAGDDSDSETSTEIVIETPRARSSKYGAVLRGCATAIVAAALMVTCRSGARLAVSEPNLDVASVGPNVTSLLDLASADDDPRVADESDDEPRAESDAVGTRSDERASAARRTSELRKRKSRQDRKETVR